MFYQFNHFGLSEYFVKETGENFSFPVHLHQAFELIVITEGEMEVMVDNKTYHLKAGESVLVFPNQTHDLKSNSSRHILLIFSTELVKAYSERVRNKRPTSNKFSLDVHFISIINNLKGDSTVFEKKGLLYLLCAEFDKTASYEDRKTPDTMLIMDVFSYVENNFQKECSLSELAEQTGYSYSYISRSFKKITGISFNSYLNQYRIRNACYLLSNTDWAILRCAYESGYASLRSFNRNFTDLIGKTPKEYRRN